MITANLDRAAKLPNHGSVKRVATVLCAFLFVASIFGAEQVVSGLLAKGTKWETPFYSRDSGKPGPTVVLTGGIHGNEPAGAGAAEQIRHWPIKRGRLIVVPSVNRPGLAKGTIPSKTRTRANAASNSCQFITNRISHLEQVWPA